MTTSKRFMDVAIVGLCVLDLLLSVLFFSGGRHPSQFSPPHSAVGIALPQTITPTASTAMADNTYLLLIRVPGAGDAHELFTCPADAKWDFGGGVNTARYWANWSPTSSAGSHPDIQRDATTTRTTSNDVSAAMSLLLRAGDITSEVFDDPTTQPSHWDYGDRTNSAQNWRTWDGTAASLRADLSYSYQNIYPKDHANAGATTNLTSGSPSSGP